MEDMLMRTLTIAAAAALLIAGSAFAQDTGGASKARKDQNPQAVPQSQGTAQVPQSSGSKARKDRRPQASGTQSGTSTPNTTDPMDPNMNPRTKVK
jgi:hypothetical protein